MLKFSERLKKLRQERGLKQREMAEICGLKLRGYQCYEYATSCPDFEGLVFLADYFNVSTDYLLGRTDCREMNKTAPDGMYKTAPDGTA